jgi:hypothetical protein
MESLVHLRFILVSSNGRRSAVAKWEKWLPTTDHWPAEWHRNWLFSRVSQERPP